MAAGDIVTSILTWLWGCVKWVEMHIATWITPFMTGKGWGGFTTIVAWILTFIVFWLAFKIIFGGRR